MASALLSRTARGVFPISITPFKDDGSLDLEGLDRMVDFYVDCDVPGITVLGILGEASKLSQDESTLVLSRALSRAAGKTRVIAGVSHTSFANIEHAARHAMDAGACAIMVSPASGLKTEDQVLNYFESLVGKIGRDTPIVLQDYPQHSGVYLSADTLSTLLERHPGIKVVKHEEGSALRKVSRLRAQEQRGERDRVSILVGNSAIHLPQELHRGVDGANTGVAFPEMLIEVCDRFFRGEAQGAEDLYDLFLPLVRHEQQPGIGLAIRKEIFRRRGLIACARVRAPGPVLDASDHRELDLLLNRLLRKLESAGESEVIKQYQIAAVPT